MRSHRCIWSENCYPSQYFLYLFPNPLSMSSVGKKQQAPRSIARCNASPMNVGDHDTSENPVGLEHLVPRSSWICSWLQPGQNLEKWDTGEFWASSTEARRVPAAGPKWEVVQVRFGASAAFVEMPLGKSAGLREADKAQGENVWVFPERVLWSSHGTIKLLAWDRESLDK